MSAPADVDEWRPPYSEDSLVDGVTLTFRNFFLASQAIAEVTRCVINQDVLKNSFPLRSAKHQLMSYEMERGRETTMERHLAFVSFSVRSFIDLFILIFVKARRGPPSRNPVCAPRAAYVAMGRP